VTLHLSESITERRSHFKEHWDHLCLSIWDFLAEEKVANFCRATIVITFNKKIANHRTVF
jgi:hypothetical protein